MATQKKYICAFCARAFTRSEHKQRHERSHTNEKPFHCLHCTSSFVRRDLLQRHCRTVHNSQLAAGGNTNGSNNGSSNQKMTPVSNGSLSTPTMGNITENGTMNGINVLNNMSNTLIHGSTSSTSTSLSVEDNLNDIEPLSISNMNNMGTSNINKMNGTVNNNEVSPRMVNMSLQTSKRRKKSNDKSLDDLIRIATANGNLNKNMTSTSNNNNLNGVNHNSKDVINHDLIHLLSIAKKLESLLISFDPSNESFALNDHFLIGYINLIQASSNYPIFDKILKDLIYYLNSYNTNKASPPLLKHSSPVPVAPNNFKIGIIYSVISMGYIINNNYAKSFKFFRKSWYLLIKKLIPNYNNNNNLLDQIEILNNLYLLSYIYLNHNLESFSSADDDEDNTFVNNDVILNYLNDISFIIISNLKDLNNSNENLIDLNINLFWNIYILLSNYLKGQPPKFYAFFLNKIVRGEDTLNTLMVKFSKSYVNLEEEEDFLKMIIITTLSNELKKFVNGDNFMIFSSKNCLHNSIILINKSINVHSSITNNSSQSRGSLQSSVKLFELFKKSIIINSPLKFHELLSNYLFIPKTYYNWELLNLTLQEINLNYPINQTLQDYLANPGAVNLDMKLKNFFNYKQNSIDINNNLSIISFPIVFFTNYLNLGLVDLDDFNVLQLNNLSLFLVEWYLIMNKILLMIWNNNELFSDNYILQNLIYLLMDNKSCMSSKLNLDMPSPSSTSPTMATSMASSNSSSTSTLSAAAALVNGEISYNEEFSFNNKWYWIVKLKFDSIFETWSDFVRDKITAKYLPSSNTNSNNMSFLKINLNRYINDLIQIELAKLNKEEKLVVNHEYFSGMPQNTNPSITPNAGNAVNPMVNYNYPDYTAGNYRRSNSITLGILGNAHNHPETSNQSNSPIISNPPSNGGSISSNNSFKTAINGNNKMNHYSSYSTYPPLPPILAASTAISLGTSGSNISSASSMTKPSANDLLLLPPILPKSDSYSGRNPEDEQASTEGKALQALVPNVMRKA
ncbi:ADR1-like Zn finger domain protein [Scheffersomyces xylosifermentans]|uniref:ADR1-like Zn finger domain protein n=1 Tax=Scheffersomyces xylosifermentans TaxID=1304137 RepID=UPI00315DEC91